MCGARDRSESPGGRWWNLTKEGGLGLAGRPASGLLLTWPRAIFTFPSFSHAKLLLRRPDPLTALPWLPMICKVAVHCHGPFPRSVVESALTLLLQSSIHGCSPLPLTFVAHVFGSRPRRISDEIQIRVCMKWREKIRGGLYD